MKFDLPPLPQLDLSVFKHPLALPYRFFAWDFEVYKSETLLVLLDCTTGEWTELWGPENVGRYLDALMLDERVVFCGFNSRGYDNAIAALCVTGRKQETVKLANDVLVGRAPLELAEEWGCELPFDRRQDAAFRTPGYFDIFARSYDAGFDLGQKMIGGEKVPALSLKKWQQLNGVPVFRTPVPFDREILSEEDKKAVAHYCRYDVASVVLLMSGKEGRGNLLGRAGLIAEKPEKMKWGMTKPKLSEIYLDADKKLCPKKTDPWPNGGVVRVPDCVRIEKYTGVLDFFRKPAAELEKSSYSCDIMGRTHKFGIGGLHSYCDEPERYEDDDIWDVDASGMYPAIMSKYGLLPRSVPDFSVFERMMERRAMLKAKKDPMSDALKIVNNSTFGATKNEFSGFFDPYVGLSICVVGQLLLVDLLERLEPYVSCLIQSNTDGLYLKLHDKSAANAAIAEFEKRTGMTMEWELYDFMYQRDVNNYVARAKKDGSLKLRGGMFHTAHATVQSPAQRIATARALGQEIDIRQFALSEFAITCTRDKNTRAFLVDGAETDDEYLEVVAVGPLDGVQINAVRHDGSLVKARLCPECALPLKSASLSDVDMDYYLNAASAVAEIEENEGE